MIQELMQSVVVLALWTFIVMLWMFKGRLGAMSDGKLDPEGGKHTSDMAGKWPSQIRSVGDNYNHLHEQPTVFYAVAAIIAIAGHADALFVQLAWAYVVLRIVHSLIQITYNKVMHRFPVFLLSAFVLGAMIIREILNLF